MINYTYRNLILCEIFSLTNVNFSTFEPFCKMKHSSFMAMVKGEKAMRFVLKRHLFAFYNSYVVLWK